MTLSDAEARSLVAIFLVLMTLIGVMAWSMRYHGMDRCEGRCYLPRITQRMGNREEYRCRECGTRYRIVVDLTKPRAEYRWWVALHERGPSTPRTGG